MHTRNDIWRREHQRIIAAHERFPTKIGFRELHTLQHGAHSAIEY